MKGFITKLRQPTAKLLSRSISTSETLLQTAQTVVNSVMDLNFQIPQPLPLTLRTNEEVKDGIKATSLALLTEIVHRELMEKDHFMRYNPALWNAIHTSPFYLKHLGYGACQTISNETIFKLSKLPEYKAGQFTIGILNLEQSGFQESFPIDKECTKLLDHSVPLVINADKVLALDPSFGFVCDLKEYHEQDSVIDFYQEATGLSKSQTKLVLENVVTSSQVQQHHPAGLTEEKILYWRKLIEKEVELEKDEAEVLQSAKNIVINNPKISDEELLGCFRKLHSAYEKCQNEVEHLLRDDKWPIWNPNQPSNSTNPSLSQTLSKQSPEQEISN